ncbi:hypothetical protein CFP56_008503, partial [Quercus suber]
KNQELERKNWELEHITQENTLLKRAVVVLHERLEQCNNKEQEIKHLKDKLTTLEENTLLKRAVVVQHERLEQCNNKEQEIKHLKDKLTTLE